MKFLGILRASALCLLVSALQGKPVSCGFFKNLLSSKKPSNANQSEISEKPKDSNVESPLVENPSQESSSEPSVSAPKSDLVFQSSTWDDSQLASTIAFINEFCKEVISKKFDGKFSDANMKGLLGACSGILGHIIPPASHVPTNSALGNLYEGVLKSDKFKDYAEWLVKHLEGIRISVANLHNETIKHSVNQLKTNKSDVLSKYGFVCNNNPNGEILHRWPSQDYRAYIFMEELEHLKKCIDKSLKSFPGNSTVKSQAV